MLPYLTRGRILCCPIGQADIAICPDAGEIVSQIAFEQSFTTRQTGPLLSMTS